MPFRLLLPLALVWLATPLAAQSSGIRTYANPVDLDYRYNWEQLDRGISYRSGADPVVVPHGGEYFLFMTISGGYWHSTDLLEWRFVEPSRWPFEGIVAPAARSVRDTLYLLQSTTVPRPILFSTAPETGRLEFYNRLLPPPPGAMSAWDQGPATPGAVPPGPWDPDIFHDPDTDRGAAGGIAPGRGESAGWTRGASARDPSVSVSRAGALPPRRPPPYLAAHASLLMNPFGHFPPPAAGVTFKAIRNFELEFELKPAARDRRSRGRGNSGSSRATPSAPLLQGCFRAREGGAASPPVVIQRHTGHIPYDAAHDPPRSRLLSTRP